MDGLTLLWLVVVGAVVVALGRDLLRGPRSRGGAV